MATFTLTTASGEVRTGLDIETVNRTIISSWIGKDWRVERRNDGRWLLVLVSAKGATEEQAIHALALHALNDPALGLRVEQEPEPEPVPPETK